MALLELIGRLGLNTQPFESGLRRARGQAESGSRDISRAFSRVGLGLLGISSIGGTFNRIVNQTVEWSKDIDAAREEFKRLGIEIDEGALRSIRETGVALERLKVSAAATATPIIGGLAKIFTMAGASTASLLNFITSPFDKDRNKKLMEDIERREMAIIGATTPDEQAKFMAERLQKLNALKGAKKVAEPIFRRPQETSLAPVGFGSLANVGTFGMVAGNAPAQRHVEMIVQYTQATAKSTAITAEQLREFRREMQFINARDEFYGGFKQL